MPISLADVHVQSLVPASLANTDRDGFMAALHELDAPMQAAYAAARERGCALRYVARLQQDGHALVVILETLAAPVKQGVRPKGAGVG